MVGLWDLWFPFLPVIKREHCIMTLISLFVSKIQYFFIGRHVSCVMLSICLWLKEHIRIIKCFILRIKYAFTLSLKTQKSDSIFFCLRIHYTRYTARNVAKPNRLFQTMFPEIEDAEINSRLVAYCSDQVRKHSSICLISVENL